MPEPDDKPPIFTIGYGLRDTDEFVTLLRRHDVRYVGDVRSAYSSRRPEFSRGSLERLLLCSEARPQDCHRPKLLAEMLVERGIRLSHIDERCELVEHSEIAAKLRGPQLSMITEGLGRLRRAYHAA